MNLLFLNDPHLGFASPGAGIVPNYGGRFNQVIDLVRGGLDTYRESRGLPQYYPAPQPPPQIPAPGPAPAAARQPQDGTEEDQSGGGRRGSSGGGFGLSWDNAGLHIGDSITLSPTMLVIGAVGIYLLQSAPVGRRR